MGEFDRVRAALKRMSEADHTAFIRTLRAIRELPEARRA